MQDGHKYIHAFQTLSQLGINGREARSARLADGDRISIGPYDLLFREAGDGANLELEVELIRPFGDDFIELHERSNTELTTLGLRKSGWSVMLTIIVLIAAFAVPALSAFLSQSDNKAADGAMVPQGKLSEAAQKVMPYISGQDWMFAADELWISGDISNAHRYFGDECSTCHQEAFTQVKDSACLGCHEGIEQHADPMRFRSTRFVSYNCQTCHKEHNGLAAIVLDDQAFCTSCHASLKEMEALSELLDVGDFGQFHPAFRPTVMVDPRKLRTVRLSLTGDLKPKEVSNLRFPHNKHLRRLDETNKNDPGGILHPDKGRIELACGDCHSPEPGGAGMQPISMQNNCEVCHGLAFEPSASERKLPHGKPREAVEQMREFYAMKALIGGLTDPNAPAAIQRRRLPGESLTTQERLDSLQWASDKAASVASETIGKRVCGTCHFVTPPAADDPSSIWNVAPVHLVDRWLPKGRFVHRDHQQESCESCHAARKSSSAGDVLLPGIERCRDCHGGAEATNKVASSCISCHEFHQPHLSSMRTKAAANGERENDGMQQVAQ